MINRARVLHYHACLRVLREHEPPALPPLLLRSPALERISDDGAGADAVIHPNAASLTDSAFYTRWSDRKCLPITR